MRTSKVKIATQVPYLYRGLIKCADCGLAITPEKQKLYVYYHCTEHKGKHGAVWVREEVLTAQFQQFFTRLQMPDKIRQRIVDALAVSHEQKMTHHAQQYDANSKQYAQLGTMLDNLYLDKLRGKLDDTSYERFYQKIKIELDEVKARLDRLQQAEDNYFVTVKYILEITKQASEIFESSETEEKRKLITMLLPNLRLAGKNIVYDVQKPFDLIFKAGDASLWCPLANAFRIRGLEIDVNIEGIKRLLGNYFVNNV